MNFKKLITPVINWVFIPPKKSQNTLHVEIYPANDYKSFEKHFKKLNSEFDFVGINQDLINNPGRISKFRHAGGYVWLCYLNPIDGSSQESEYVWSRDFSGGVFNFCKSEGIGSTTINTRAFKGSRRGFLDEGFVVGLENASYHFLSAYKGKVSEVKTEFFLTSKKQDLQKYLALAQAMIIARHLVNLPPNDLNPKSYADIMKKEIPFSKNSTVEVWSTEKCKSEKMNLLLAVGQGSENTACMVHIKYRPAKAKKGLAPLAFVGKGITFDTGGLDIKPSSAMRLMKKDMGGSAAIAALAYWVDAIGYSRPCDFYLALAENSVDSKSMRPSDIYQSRAGYFVEIDNTDAEGRLVLADVMNVAVTRKERPSHLIDVATLTGAIKVALGSEVAGLFSNDDKLAEQLHRAGEQINEPNWRMPLVSKYFSALSSNFADFRNSGDGGFGGAIHAALFLEKFADVKPEEGKKGTPIKWAHLDVYSWTDRPNGPFSTGGSSQPVQTLVQWLRSL